MRRILWWLPALALVACQGDVPTAADEGIMAAKSGLPDNVSFIIPDNVLNDENELLWIILPGETRDMLILLEGVIPGDKSQSNLHGPAFYAFADWTRDGTDDAIFRIDTWFCTELFFMGGVVSSSYKAQFNMLVGPRLFPYEWEIEQPITVFCPYLGDIYPSGGASPASPGPA